MFGPGPLRDNVDFRRYWLGQAASDLGTQLSLVAFPLLVLALGGTPAQAGGIATGSLVARTVCRLPAGVLVDRLDRKRLMIGSDLIRATALGSIPLAVLFGGPEYPHLLVVAVVEGAAGSVFWPSAAASVRRLVVPHQLTAAMVRSQARVRAAALLGPALAGWLFTLHRLVPFFVDACSYLVSALLIGRISASLRPDPPSPSTDGKAAAPDRRLSAGIRWFLAHRELRTMVAYGGVINLISVSTVLAVVVSANRHGHSATAIGLLVACVGVGALGGALLTSALLRRLSAPAVFLTLGAAWVVTFLVFVGTSSPWVVGPLLATVYVLTAPSAVLIGKQLILGAPENLLGRVTTAADLLMSGLPALGPLLTGILLSTVGFNATWLALAALIAGATVVCLPTFRTLGPTTEAAPGPAPIPAPTPAPSPEPDLEDRHDALRHTR